MTFSISFAKEATKETNNTIVLGIFQENELSQAAQIFNENQENAVENCLKSHPNFKGKSGETLSMAGAQDEYNHIILLGLGEKEKLNNLAFETIGGKLLGALEKAGTPNVTIHLEGIEDLEKTTTAEIAAHLALGLKLTSYRFEKYKSPKEDDKKVDIKTVTIITDAHSAATKLYKNQSAVAQGVFLARDLVNEPPNKLYPESYAELIKNELKPLGIDVEILDEKKMKKLGFEALLTVGHGSTRESQAVIMKWNGDGKIKKNTKNPIAFVGKGVTFDAGGISLKPGGDMDLMKMDMGGSAAVVGLMKALAARQAKANVIGIVGLVENMPSDRAYRPGDVISSYAGKTIEILNTDAEGRLVLADTLSYIQKTYKPSVVIDLATLTGAIVGALGLEYGGAFANDDALWDQIKQASDNTGEKFWRMPLDESFRKEMESDIADLKNLGGRFGGACTAAGFLEAFIEDGVKWAHLDIAKIALDKGNKASGSKGEKGFAVRALNDLVEKHFEKK